MFVYVIVCSETLKIYVGQHSGPNLGKYLSKKFYDANRRDTRSYLYAAMRKYPRESWSIHPLVSDIRDKKELDELERHYIRILKTQHPAIGYNICAGGEGSLGRVLSSETRAKISIAHRGQKHTPTSLAKMSAAQLLVPRKGVPRPPEVVAAMHTPEAKEKAHKNSAASQKGKKRPDIAERKRRWWESHPGKKFSLVRNEKISRTMKGRAPLAALQKAHAPETEAKRQLTRFLKTVAWG